MKKFILLMLISGTALADKSDVNSLAEILYFEARGAGEAELTDVANLALNLSDKEQKNIKGTMKIRGKFDHIRFKWKISKKDNKEWDNMLKFAKIFLSKPRSDTTHGATLFHNVKVHPKLDYSKLIRTKTTKYHHYYKEKSRGTNKRNNV
jgi:hypothetical protein